MIRYGGSIGITWHAAWLSERIVLKMELLDLHSQNEIIVCYCKFLVVNQGAVQGDTMLLIE
jgi:hypothetical protein